MYYLLNYEVYMTSIRELTAQEADKVTVQKTIKDSLIEFFIELNEEILADVNDIVAEIKEDSVIDKLYLFDVSVNQSMIHSKWLTKLNSAKRDYRKLKEKQDKYNLLLWKYYQGKMTLDKAREFAGTLQEHVLKSDVEKYLHADELWIIMKEATQNQYSIVEMCEQMMDANKQRGYAIKNAIEIKKFEAGF